MSPQLFTIENEQLRVVMMDFGARLISLEYRNAGNWKQCLRTLPSAMDYLSDTESMGASVGRYANRIAGARFSLNGDVHVLSKNHGAHCLHGGAAGFGTRIWDAEQGPEGLRFNLLSADGDQGFPGNLNVQLAVTLRGAELQLLYSARSDATTHVNLTSHPYFDLSGTGDLNRHHLTVNGAQYLPVDSEMLPTGELLSVATTPFDFRQRRRLGDVLNKEHPQLAIAQGIDHCIVLDPAADNAAILEAEGIQMRLSSNLPGLQVYTANHSAPPYSAVCLEPQCFPDSPNQPQFPSTVLHADERFEAFMSYTFSSLS